MQRRGDLATAARQQLANRRRAATLARLASWQASGGNYWVLCSARWITRFTRVTHGRWPLAARCWAGRWALGGRAGARRAEQSRAPMHPAVAADCHQTYTRTHARHARVARYSVLGPNLLLLLLMMLPFPGPQPMPARLRLRLWLWLSLRRTAHRYRTDHSLITV